VGDDTAVGTTVLVGIEVGKVTGVSVATGVKVFVSPNIGDWVSIYCSAGTVHPDISKNTKANRLIFCFISYSRLFRREYHQSSRPISFHHHTRFTNETQDRNLFEPSISI
jgi:hypothetical protein